MNVQQINARIERLLARVAVLESAKEKLEARVAALEYQQDKEKGKC